MLVEVLVPLGLDQGEGALLFVYFIMKFNFSQRSFCVLIFLPDGIG